MPGNQGKNEQVGIHKTMKYSTDTNEQREKTAYKKREYICTSYIS